nr:MAG TPA: hypothetical protein [Caudoviricetes sp.]
MILTRFLEKMESVFQTGCQLWLMLMWTLLRIHIFLILTLTLLHTIM